MTEDEDQIMLDKLLEQKNEALRDIEYQKGAIENSKKKIIENKKKLEEASNKLDKMSRLPDATTRIIILAQNSIIETMDHLVERFDSIYYHVTNEWIPIWGDKEDDDLEYPEDLFEELKEKIKYLDELKAIQEEAQND